MRSIKEALKTFSEWYGILGFIVAVFALINLCVAAYNVELTEILRAIIETYRRIAHTMVDWLFWWFPYAMPMFAKDGVVLWLIIGGAVARTQDRFMRVRTRTLKDTLYTSLGYPSTSDMQPDTSRYLGRIYNNSPRWLRILIDLFLWPRVVGKFFRMPFASIGKTKEYTWYDVYNSKLEHDKTKEKDGYLASFDLRIVFFIQVLMIIMAAFFVLSFDSFAMPLNIN